MKLSEKDILRRLGSGEPIDSVCTAAGISRADFDNWWSDCVQERATSREDRLPAPVTASVHIHRDEWGIPHIFAENDADLFHGYGFAMAQDRLFQLDYLRRKGAGRLSEILGPDGLETDLTARTVGLPRIAREEWSRLPQEIQTLLESFSAGINTFIGQLGDHPPIEFDLLDYRPEPWSPVDCLIIENEFRWYLTGRLPVIAIPEIAKRVLGDGELYREFLRGEADDECIMPAGSYTSAEKAAPPEAVGQAMGMPQDGVGSNNWVVSGRLTENGKPLVASDPHIAFEAVSCWYEARLCGGSFHVAGMSYVGMPAMIIGRNERVAWGITNNICSLRDLYQEQIDSAHPNCFLYDGQWEPSRELRETIQVRGSKPVERTIRFSRNGPIINELLPEPLRQSDPVSLKWLGAFQGGWLASLLNMSRAENAGQFKSALEPWHVPTFSMVFADVDGHIGFKASGRIPVRLRPERGFRKGWDPEDQWNGLIPFDEMPELMDPDQGWIATANNRVAADDFPHPLAGTWSRGHRAIRIREMLEERLQTSGTGERKLTFEDCREMQQDVKSLRAAECLPSLLSVLEESHDNRVRLAADILRRWDQRSEMDQVGPTLFNVFFTHWTQAVVEERFNSETGPIVASAAEAIASRLLQYDPHGWFSTASRERSILAAFEATLNLLNDRLGSDMSEWTWGRLHRLPLKHVLSSRGDLSQLLDQQNVPVKGDMGTICNTGSDAEWSGSTGSGYRFLADLAEHPLSLWASDGQSQSGNPGDRHYGDQLTEWLAGRYHQIRLDRERNGIEGFMSQTLEPPA